MLGFAANTVHGTLMRPSPALQSDSLIERLNALRAARELSAEALGQIRFAAQGLRNSDPPGFLGINGMIAALENNRGALDAIASELNAKYPYEVQDHLNVVRSYMAIREYQKAEEHALALLSRLQSPDPWIVGWTAYAFLMNGSLRRSLDVVQKYKRFLNVEASASLLDTARILERMNALEVDEESFSQFLETGYAALANRGWKFPALMINQTISDHDGNYPAAMVSFLLDAGVDETLDSAEDVMDALLATNNPLFVSGAVTVSVKPTDDEHYYA